MDWTNDAKKILSRVPFFIRGTVRERVEKEALRCGAKLVTPVLIDRCKKRYMNQMEEEVKGYRIETCFGRSGCPNRAISTDDLCDELERRLPERNLKTFLMNCVKGPLKLHHEFLISISDCPNGCSRPQIADIGIIGACTPAIGKEPCTSCASCVEACREEAILLQNGSPVIDHSKCLGCGKCIKACPSGTLISEMKGHRILTGGRLGRHPRLAEELSGIHDLSAGLQIIERCLDIYQSHCRKGERFGEILQRLRDEAGHDPLSAGFRQA